MDVDKRRGGVLSGLLLTALGIIVLMVMAGIFVARNVHVRTIHRDSGSDVSINLPGGHFSMRGHDHLNAASLDIPIYPGATQNHDAGGAAFEWSSDDGKEDKAFSVSGADMVTTDPANKVVAYYRSQLPSWFMVSERDGTTRLELDKDGYKRIVGIKEKGDGTHIGVASIGEPASN